MQFAVWSQLKEFFHSKSQDTKLWKHLRSVLKFKQKFSCFIWGSSSCGPSTFAKEYLPPIAEPPYMDSIPTEKYQRIHVVGSFLILLCCLKKKKKASKSPVPSLHAPRNKGNCADSMQKKKKSDI